MNLLSVGIGGFLGALARYYIYIPINSNSVFPWVNLSGSFFLALFLTLALRYFFHRSFLVLSISTGFTGAFTTFSSVSVEAVNLAYKAPMLLLGYIGVSFFAGLLLAFAGRHIGIAVSSSIDERIRAGEGNS